MAYTLPAGRTYVDEKAAALYKANVGKEIVVSQVVNAPVDTVFDAWVNHIWKNGPGSKEITPGEGRGLVNHTRELIKMKVEEQIQSAGVPKAGDKVGVPSVLYKVTKKGVLPIQDHIALVRFIQDFSQGKPKTEIVWTVKITANDKVFAMVGPNLQKTIGGGLAQFAKAFGGAQSKL